MSGRGSSPHPGRASILRAPSARCPRWNTDRPRGGAPVAVSSRGPGPSASGPGNPGLAPSRPGDAPRSAQAFHGIAEALDLRVDVRVSHGILELLPEDRGSRLKPGHIETGEDLAHRLGLLDPVAHRDDGRREDGRLGIEVRVDGGHVVPSVLPRPDLPLDLRSFHRLRDLRLLDDLRGPLEDRIRVFADEAVHVHAGMELQDARLVVRVLPHLLQGAPPAVLGAVAMVQAGLRVSATEEHDPFGPLPGPAPNRPDVAGERILLQVEEQLLERVRTAPRGADEFSLWQEEVLRREAPSVAPAHSRGPSKKVPTQFSRLRTGGMRRGGGRALAMRKDYYAPGFCVACRWPGTSSRWMILTSRAVRSSCVWTSTLRSIPRPASC